MKITKEQIKQLINEELIAVLREEEEEGYDDENHPLLNVRRIEEGEENILPLQYGDELMTIYSYSVTEILFGDYYFKSVAEEDKEKIKELAEDNIFVLLDGTMQSNSTIELMRSLDSNFEGYPIGELTIGNGGETGLIVQWLGDTLDVIEGKDNIQNGQIEVFYGHGVVSPDYIGSIVRADVEDDKENLSIIARDGGENTNCLTLTQLVDNPTYLSEWEGGVAVQGCRDEPTIAKIRIDKILNDIDNGTLGLEVIGEYGEFKYKVEKY